MRVAFIFVLSGLAGILGNMIASWAQETWQLTNPARIGFTIGTFFTVLAIGLLLHTGAPVPGRIVFHRFWYLFDLARSPVLRRWRTYFSALHLGRGPRYVPTAEVIAEGERRDLVGFLSQLVRGRERSGRRILILGEPGSGKSTAAERLVLELAAYTSLRMGLAGPIPVLIRAGDQRRDEDITNIVSDAVARWARGRTRTVLTDPKTIDQLLESRRLVLIVDALDELSGERRTAVLQALATPSRSSRLEHIPIIVTCRTRQDPEHALPDFHTYNLLELSDESVVSFVRAYARDTEIAPEQILADLQNGRFLETGGLGRNPFWLRELIRAGTRHRTRSGILATASHEAFSFELSKAAGVARKWSLRGDLSKDEHIGICEQGLARLTQEMQTDRQISKTKALWTLQRWQAGRKESLGVASLPPEELLELCRDAGIIDRSQDPVAFTHRLMQEYFTALSFKLNNEVLHSQLSVCIDDPGRWQTLALFVGLLSEEEQSPLVASILADGESPQRVACAIAACVGDGALRAASLAPRLIELLRARLAIQEQVDPQLRESVRQLLVMGHNHGADFLGQLLADPDRTVRTRVYSLLTLSEAPEAMRLIVYAGLDDYDTTVANHVMELLIKTGNRAVWPLIRQLYAECDIVRERAAKVLGSIKAPEAVNFLLECDIQDNETVVNALASCGEQRMGRLLIAVAADQTEHRKRALQALSNCRHRHAYTVLKRCLVDTDPIVRSIAGIGLGNWCRRGDDTEASEQQFVSAIENAFDESPNARSDLCHSVAGELSNLLETWDSELTVKTLVGCLGHKSAAIRDVGRNSLRYWVGKTDISAELIQALGSNNSVIRRSAVTLLAERDGDTVTRALVSALNDDSELVRKEAVSALSERQSPDTIQLLVDVCYSSTKRLRVAALQTLARRKLEKDGIENVITVVKRSAKDVDDDVRYAGLLVASKLPTADVFDVLMNSRDDSSGEVRAAAISALSRSAQSFLSADSDLGSPKLDLTFDNFFGIEKRATNAADGEGVDDLFASEHSVEQKRNLENEGEQNVDMNIEPSTDDEAGHSEEHK